MVKGPLRPKRMHSKPSGWENKAAHSVYSREAAHYTKLTLAQEHEDEAETLVVH